MKAVIINKFGGPEVLEIADVEKPEPKESFYPHMIQNATKCTGVRIFSSHIYDNRPERLAEIKKAVFGLLMSGKVDMNEYFYGDFGLEDVVTAHELLDS